MKRHVSFDSIDCEKLQYVLASRSWVCLRHFCDLDDVSDCVTCLRNAQWDRENKLRSKKDG